MSVLVLLVGRADILNDEKTAWVLDRLESAAESVQFKGKIVLTGGLPAAHDRRIMCEDLAKERQIIQKHVQCSKRMLFCDAADVMSDHLGVIPQLMDYNGLTLDRIREFQQRLCNIENI